MWLCRDNKYVGDIYIDAQVYVMCDGLVGLSIAREDPWQMAFQRKDMEWLK